MPMSHDSEQPKNLKRQLSVWVLVGVVLVSLICIRLFWPTGKPIRTRSASARQTPPPPSVEVALAPIQGATSVSRDGGAFDSFWVSYVLKARYPAADVTQEISTRLKKLGWRPLQEDWLNPGRPLPQVPQWFVVTEELPGTAPQHVDEWTAQWENDAGELIDYTLRYSYAKTATPDRRTLSISSGWYPADGKAESQQLVQELRASSWKRWLRPWLPRWLGF
jgi:hypothetical protein